MAGMSLPCGAIVAWLASCAGATITSTVVPVTGTRDLVWDQARGVVWFGTADGSLGSYRPSTGAVLPSIPNVAVDPKGMDITPDGSAMYIADAAFSGVTNYIRRVDLTTGAKSAINFTRDDAQERGVWDVSIDQAGIGLVTTVYAGSGFTPPRRLDTHNNSLAFVHDAAGAKFDVGGGARIGRTRDRAATVMLDVSRSHNLYTYDSVTNKALFTASLGSNYAGDGDPVFSRDGKLVAVYQSGIRVVNTDTWQDAHQFSGFGHGMCFDPTRNWFWAVDNANFAGGGILYAYDTITWAQVSRTPFGDIYGGNPWDLGQMEISDDGSRLFLSTSAGMRVFAIPAPGAGAIFMASTLIAARRSNRMDRGGHRGPTLRRATEIGPAISVSSPPRSPHRGTR